VKAKLLAASGLTAAGAGRRVHRLEKKKGDGRHRALAFGKRIHRRILSEVSALEKPVESRVKNIEVLGNFLNCRG